MTRDELARQLDGREYRHEIDRALAAEAKDAGLVVVFGYSDDNVEFCGAISEEVSAYGGIAIPITPEGLLSNECDADDCPYFKALVKNATATIEAVWCAKGEPLWTFKTDIPHSTFLILEGNDQECRGIVFALADVPAEKPGKK